MALHASLQAELAIDAIKVCPHTDTDRCDCRKPKPGLLIIPGMIDLHVHFGESARPGAQPTFVADLRRLFPFEQEIAWMKARVPFTLTRYLCSGVTSVVVQGAIPWEYQGRTLAESTGVGPRVFLAGGVVDVIPADSLYPPWGNDRMSYLLQTASAAAPLMDTLAATRIDLLKVAYDLPARATAAEHAEAIAPFVALFRESHKRGLRVSAHATSLVEAKQVLQAGVDILAHPVHSGPVDDEFLALSRFWAGYPGTGGDAGPGIALTVKGSVIRTTALHAHVWGMHHRYPTNSPAIDPEGRGNPAGAHPFKAYNVLLMHNGEQVGVDSTAPFLAEYGYVHGDPSLGPGAADYQGDSVFERKALTDTEYAAYLVDFTRRVLGLTTEEASQIISPITGLDLEAMDEPRRARL